MSVAPPLLGGRGAIAMNASWDSGSSEVIRRWIGIFVADQERWHPETRDRDPVKRVLRGVAGGWNSSAFSRRVSHVSVPSGPYSVSLQALVFDPLGSAIEPYSEKCLEKRQEKRSRGETKRGEQKAADEHRAYFTRFHCLGHVMTHPW